LKPDDVLQVVSYEKPLPPEQHGKGGFAPRPDAPVN
jgi:hypothetical protein